jgi:hypothetical protein
MDAREQAAEEARGLTRHVHERPAPRGRHLKRLALVLFGALALAGCGSDSSGGDSDEARRLIERTFAKEVESANLKLDLEAKLEGVALLGTAPLTLTLEGPYQSNGDYELPSVDWKVKGSGAGQSFDAGIVTTAANAFVEYGGSTYEVGEDIISRFESQTRAQQKKGGKTTWEDFGLKPDDWLEDAEVSEGEAVGGEATRKVSGKLDVADVLRGLNKALESETAKKQLGTGNVDTLSEDQIEQVSDAVDDPRFELDIGKSDGLLRRLRAELDFDVPEDSRDELGGLKGGSFSFEIRFEDVNRPVEVKAPSGARPLSELLRQFGIAPELLLGAGATVPEPQ